MGDVFEIVGLVRARAGFARLLAALVLAVGLGLAAPAVAQTRLPPEGFADLAERLTPAVVNISTTQRVDGLVDTPRFPRGSPLERFNEDFGGGGPEVSSLGSGFIISPEGVVVTNNHVIEGAETIEVIMQDGERFPARVVGRDPATDLAVLQVQAGRPLPFVRFGDSDRARVGDLVIAIGNPFGLGGTVTVGIISARNRNIEAGRFDDFIQTDAAINRGNSGGPLFNMAGEVIGVNTAIVSPSGGSVGVGFAAPSALAQGIVAQLQEFGETRRGWLGVRLSPLSVEVAQRSGVPAGTGAIVSRVTPGGPAARAGVRAGDVVVRFNGEEVRDARALSRAIAEAEIGRTVGVEVRRAGRLVSLSAEIGRLQEDPTAPVGEGARDQGPAVTGRVLGMTLSELTNDVRRRYGLAENIRGLVVMSVDPTSDAHTKMQPGDVILDLGFERVETIAQARAIAERAVAARRPLLVRMSREGDITVRALRVTRR